MKNLQNFINCNIFTPLTDISCLPRKNFSKWIYDIPDATERSDIVLRLTVWWWKANEIQSKIWFFHTRLLLCHLVITVHKANPLSSSKTCPWSGNTRSRRIRIVSFLSLLDIYNKTHTHSIRDFMFRYFTHYFQWVDSTQVSLITSKYIDKFFISQHTTKTGIHI